MRGSAIVECITCLIAVALSSYRDKLSSGKPVAMQLARDVAEIQLAAADEIRMR